MSFIVLAQLKFVGVSVVPQLYLSLMFATSVFARWAVMPVPGTEWPFVVNVLFWLGVISLVLTIALTIKKIWGRVPPLDKVLSEFITSVMMNEYKEEQRLRCLGLEKQISDARHSFDERANSDLVESDKRFQTIFRLMEERDKAIQSLSGDMSRLHERTETHIRKFDSLDQKLDRFMERLPRERRT